MLELEDKLKLLYAHRPWEGEPDHAEWETRGLRCRIHRNTITLTLCGYVGLPKNHVFWGITKESKYKTLWSNLVITAHGGLSYAQEGDDGWWWLGFDTAHSHDFAPGLAIFHPPDARDTRDYRTWEYVDAEILNLVRVIEDAVSSMFPQEEEEEDNDYGPGDRFELGD